MTTHTPAFVGELDTDIIPTTSHDDSPPIRLAFNQSLGGDIDILDLGYVGHPSGLCVVCAKERHLRYQVALRTNLFGDVFVGSDCLEHLIQGDERARTRVVTIARKIDRLAPLAFTTVADIVAKNARYYIELYNLEIAQIAETTRLRAESEAAWALARDEATPALIEQARQATLAVTATRSAFEKKHDNVTRRAVFLQSGKPIYGSAKYFQGTTLQRQLTEHAEMSYSSVFKEKAAIFIALQKRKLSLEGKALAMIEFDLRAVQRFVSRTPKKLSLRRRPVAGGFA